MNESAHGHAHKFETTGAAGYAVAGVAANVAGTGVGVAVRMS
jgi:hypothetical protein